MISKQKEITYDDFAKMQFQVGEIIACEEVKKSRPMDGISSVPKLPLR